MRDAGKKMTKKKIELGFIRKNIPFVLLNKNASFVYLSKHSGLDSAVLHHDKSETHRM